MQRARANVVFGTGAEDPRFWKAFPSEEYDLGAWRRLLDECDYVGVRGRYSQFYLSEIGISSEVIGDPAARFSVRPDGFWQPKDKTIGLSITTSNGFLWGGEQSVQDIVVGFADCLKASGWKIRLYVVCREDASVMNSIAHRIGLGATSCVTVYHDPYAFMDSVRDLQRILRCSSSLRDTGLLH